MRDQRGCDVCIFIYIVSIMSIVHISLPIIGNMLSLLSVAYYKPDWFLLFYPCGTKFHKGLKRLGHVAEGKASDQMNHQSACVDRMDSRSTESHQKHVA